MTATALFGPDACAAIGHDVCDVLMTGPGQRELVGHALAEVAAGRVWTATVAGGSLGEGRFAVRWEPIAGPGGTVLVGCAAFGRAPASPAFNPGDVARALQRGASFPASLISRRAWRWRTLTSPSGTMSWAATGMTSSRCLAAVRRSSSAMRWATARKPPRSWCSCARPRIPDGLVESRTRTFDDGLAALRAALSSALAEPGSTLDGACQAVTGLLREHGEDDITLLLARSRQS